MGECVSLKTLTVLVPVYNEANTLKELLNAVYAQVLPQNLNKEILVIESASTDGSREIVESFVREKAGRDPKNLVRAIFQKSPKGKGFAVREGLASATGEIFLIQDGDLEYDVADYPLVLAPILEGRAQFVLGSRHLSSGNWKIRSFGKTGLRSLVLNLGGVFFHSFFNLLYGVRLTDPTTMFKVFRKSCIEGVGFVSNRFDFDFELVAKLIRLGHIPLEVPVSYRSRGFAEGKKVRVFADPISWVRAILRFRFQRIERLPAAQH